MKEFISTPLFGIALTILIFSLAQYISKITKNPLFNPIALSIVAIIYILKSANIDYKTYNFGAKQITFFIGPATVALAIGLYKKIKLLAENFIAIILGILVGSFTGLVSVILLSKAFEIEDIIILSMIPKSTTSAIAMDIATSIGGTAALAITFVTATGILGNIIGPSIFKLFKINNKIAQGISMGTASHVVGTAKAIELGEVEGGMSSLAIGIAGLTTVLLVPLVLKYLGL